MSEEKPLSIEVEAGQSDGDIIRPIEELTSPEFKIQPAITNESIKETVEELKQEFPNGLPPPVSINIGDRFACDSDMPGDYTEVWNISDGQITLKDFKGGVCVATETLPIQQFIDDLNLGLENDSVAKLAK